MTRSPILSRHLLPVLGVITIFFLFLQNCRSTGDTATEVDFRSVWDTTRVLENPDKGWYHHLHDNGAWRYEIKNDSIFHSFPGMDHIYLRLAWSYLEPEEGVFDWHLIDTVVDKYVPLGYGISFRISAKERRGYPEAVGQRVEGVNYATPKWVRDAGAQGVEVVSKGGALTWCPDWDDPVFLEKLDHFHRAFAQRYDDKPWVRYVDVGSIGDYGEGHTHASTRVPPTVEEVKANIDIHVKHYRQSQLACTWALLEYNKDSADLQELFDYAISNGLTLRNDSPMVGWYVQTYMDSWTVKLPGLYDPLYLDLPIIFELQHYSAVKRDGHWLGRNGSDTVPSLGVTGAQIFRGAMETIHATWIGYHGYAEEFLQDNPDFAGELLNRCGYWYFPVSARYPSGMGAGTHTIHITWLNKGVAPAYTNYPLVFRFEPAGEQGQPFDMTIEENHNTEWVPGAGHEESYVVEIPENVPRGNYLIKFKLQKQSDNSSRDVLVGIEASLEDEEHFVTLGEVRLY